jgi:protein-L-isoaspartate(D-aspartate) O-methyltransferase
MSRGRNSLIKKIRLRGLNDERVLSAMASVPREEFVPEESRELAYDDAPLPIGEGQTISQPSLVALMTKELALDEDSKVLEIGTGCGYQTAILSKLAKEVYSIEVRPALAMQAEDRLKKLGITNVHLRTGNGMHGWADSAPFDAIILTAAASEFPKDLWKQLKDKGRMIYPLTEKFDGQTQTLMKTIKKSTGNPESSRLFPVRFVPIVTA